MTTHRDDVARRACEAYYAHFGLPRVADVWDGQQEDHREAWRAVANAIGPRCDGAIWTETPLPGHLDVKTATARACTLPAWHRESGEECR